MTILSLAIFVASMNYVAISDSPQPAAIVQTLKYIINMNHGPPEVQDSHTRVGVINSFEDLSRAQLSINVIKDRGHLEVLYS